VIREVQSYGLNVHVHDPVASPGEACAEYGVELVEWDNLPVSEAIVAAVRHRSLVGLPIEKVLAKLGRGGAYADAKCSADVADLRARGVTVWRL